MAAEFGYVALSHKVWIGSLTPEYCDETRLGPLMEHPPALRETGAPKLALRDLQISARRRCAIATYANRADALAALEALREPDQFENKQPRHFNVGFALRYATLRVTFLTPEVTEELLRQAFTQHGKLADRPDAVELVYDEDHAFTGTAYIRYERRGAAARMAQACASNLLMMGNSVAPVKVDFPPGTLDTDGIAGLVDDAQVPWYGGSMELLEGECHSDSRCGRRGPLPIHDVCLCGLCTVRSLPSMPSRLLLSTG